MKRLSRFHTVKTLIAGAALLSLLAVLAPTLATAQALPADSVFRNFELNGDFELSVDGVSQPKASVYFSKNASAYLVRSAQFQAPMLILPRAKSVQRVSIMKLVERDGGYVDLLADAVLDQVGSYAIKDQKIHFTVDGKKVALGPKPPLLGARGADEMYASNPSYAKTASAYAPGSADLAKLRKQGRDVRVRVFFGSWCKFCTRYVPQVIKLEEELADTSVRFEYFGLPPEINTDPEARKFDVDSVPTGIVYVDGKEVGRIRNNGWRSPETSILELLSKG